MNLNDKDKVSIVAGICLFGLVFVLKNVLLVPPDFRHINGALPAQEGLQVHFR